MMKEIQKWFTKLARLPRGATLKICKSLCVNVIIFMLVVAAAVWMSRSLDDADAYARFGNSYYGDNIADGDEFDYIVVGSGAAGSVVAARLTLAGFHVLLVEAGGDPTVLAQIPGVTFALAGSSMDWYYDTVANNKSCFAYEGQRCRLTRGRCLGGSTSINYMMYTRGNRQDYDFNITGWTWEDMEPYFLRYEGLRDLHRLPKSSEPYHNTSGFVSIGYFGESGNPWHGRLIEGLQSLNFPYNPDVNTESQIGVTQVLGFTSGGERVSTVKAYLDRQGVREKLMTAKNTRCIKIIIDNDNVARGVIVSRRNNETLRLYAKREVVLSAGAISTAQILMLSGVGPADHLQHLGIPVKADLPVGEEMLDHVLPILYVGVDHDARPITNPSTIASKSVQVVQWLTRRSGALTSVGLTDVTAFANMRCYNDTLRQLVNDRAECETPNVQFLFYYADKGLFNVAQRTNQMFPPYAKEVFDQISDASRDSAFIVVSPVVLQPESRGSVRLASADPLAPPAIRPNFLDDERDLEEMVRGLLISEHLFESPVFKKRNAKVLKIRFPECPEIESTEYWKCYGRRMTHSAQHTMGTAALGKVADERLRVRGVRRLRVGDAAVFPRLPRGNTAAAIIALGERLSDFLIQDSLK